MTKSTARNTSRPYSRPSSLPARILARFFLVGVGFLLGLALFTPWNKIWAQALAILDDGLPTVSMRWEAIDRDGPFGFRVRDLVVTVADTPGAFAFHRAYVTMGFNPLATVRLDTKGAECVLAVHRNGAFEFEGDLNLTSLLGGADFQGTLHAAGRLFMPAGSALPKNGWLDLRSQKLLLPGGRSIEDMAFTGEIADADLVIRDFSIRAPLDVKVAGTGVLHPGDLFRTTYDVEGEIVVGRRNVEYADEGVLADVLW